MLLRGLGYGVVLGWVRLVWVVRCCVAPWLVRVLADFRDDVRFLFVLLVKISFPCHYFLVGVFLDSIFVFLLLEGSCFFKGVFLFSYINLKKHPRIPLFCSSFICPLCSTNINYIYSSIQCSSFPPACSLFPSPFSSIHKHQRFLLLSI